MSAYSIKTRGCLSAAIGLGPEDTSRFNALHDGYIEAGMAAQQAARQAAADLAGEIVAEAKALSELVAPMVSEAAPAEAAPSQPEPAPKTLTARRAAAVEQQVVIDDFGQKLEGARKDYAAKMQDALSVDIAAEPLSKSWPEPNYQQLLDAGADAYAVAFIHAARDEVPTKPQKSWKLKGWEIHGQILPFKFNNPQR